MFLSLTHTRDTLCVLCLFQSLVFSVAERWIRGMDKGRMRYLLSHWLFKVMVVERGDIYLAHLAEFDGFFIIRIG